MTGKKRKSKPKGPVDHIASDDEPTFKKDDPMLDDVDDFHASRDKVLLEKGTALGPADISEGEEEVLGIVSDSEDDEEVEGYKARLKKLKQHQHIKSGFQSSDEDEDGDSEDDGGQQSWGTTKRRFYDGDVKDDQVDLDGSGSEPEDAALEEQEALKLQQKMAKQLEDDDFGLDMFSTVSKPTEKTEEKIATDVSKLSRRDKLELLKKESPELLELLDEYKDKLTAVESRYLPLNELIKSGRISPSAVSKYIQTKLALYLNYCVNVSFYLMLKAKHSPQATSHPVVQRLVQHRKLIKEMGEVGEKMEPHVDVLLTKMKNGESMEIDVPVLKNPISNILKRAKKREEKRRKKDEDVDDAEEYEQEEGHIPEGGRSWGRKRKAGGDGFTSGEREAMNLYSALKKDKKRKQGEEGGDDRFEEAARPTGEITVEGELEDDEKRGVTYQILKNKGLQAPKKKELRNPRVKHRMKYRKAKIRRKGQVREARTEMTRYGGELSGIRAGIKRSTKFK